MKLKPYYLGLVLLILLGLTASSAFGVGGAGTATGGTFPACVDPANANTSTVKIAGKVVAPGGLVRVPTGSTCLSSETTLNLNSYVKTVLVSPGPDNVANGTNLRNAVNTAPAGTLVKLEPGTFDLATTPLTMKQGVDLEGSGEGLTTITSQIVTANFPPTSATVVITNSSELRFLSVSNTSSFSRMAAIYASGVNKTAKLTSVTMTASGTNSFNFGIFNDNSSSPTIQNSTISGSGGGISTNYGIFNDNFSPPIIQNSTITASGGNANLGIANNNSSSSIIQNSTVIAEGGGFVYGISNYASFPTIQNSVITAIGSGSEHYSIDNNSSTSKVGGSQLIGAVNGTGFTCVASYDANFVALGPTCT